MKKISKILWAAASIYLFSCMPAQAADRDRIRIIGRAERKLQWDRAIFSMELSVIGNSLDRVLKKIKLQVKELKRFWEKEGIDPSMIYTKDLKITVQDLEYGNKAHKYSITCPVTILIDDMDKAKFIQEKTLGFVEKDFIFSSQSLTYTYTKKLALYKKLILEALNNGKEMAQTYAKALGFRISAHPLSIEKEVLTTHPITSHPSPYAENAYTSDEVENIYVLKIPMVYEILPPENKLPEMREKL